MKQSIFLRGALAAVFALALAALAPAWAQAPFDPPGLDNAIAAKAFHVDALMATPGVVGVGVGLTAGGQAAVVIMTADLWVTGLARSLDGVPVLVKVTGAFHAINKPDADGNHDHGDDGDTTTEIDPTGWFDRPVPIGVSSGNEGSCSAGTIGARVRDVSGNVYALSNNHVYALSNDAPKGSGINQPGLFDRYDGTDCVPGVDDQIGTLTAFERIFFDDMTENTIDAAIAAVEMMDDGFTPKVGTSTPSDGYGIPNSVLMFADADLLGQAVQKYGRTTGLTTGTVAVIDATVRVGYASGIARFVEQIVVDGDKGGFLNAGDSGSLLVTYDTAANPVGLLFASGRGGKIAIANPIDLVLDAFQVSIDGS